MVTDLNSMLCTFCRKNSIQDHHRTAFKIILELHKVDVAEICYSAHHYLSRTTLYYITKNDDACDLVLLPLQSIVLLFSVEEGCFALSMHPEEYPP